MKLYKLITGTAKDNIPSVRLLSAVGFTKTGENIGSLGEDENGNPIESVGYSYEMLLNR